MATFSEPQTKDIALLIAELKTITSSSKTYYKALELLYECGLHLYLPADHPEKYPLHRLTSPEKDYSK